MGETTLEKINREKGAEIRGKYGTKKGNEIIRTIAETKGNCKYPLFGHE